MENYRRDQRRGNIVNFVNIDLGDPYFKPYFFFLPFLKHSFVAKTNLKYVGVVRP